MSTGSAFVRISSWCSYQERSQQETRRKLQQMGISKKEAEEIIAKLISENFLNEERFALAFAGGRFRIKHWGRNKIRAALRMHNVSNANLENALASLPSEEYERAISLAIDKKMKLMPFADRHRRYHAVMSYAVSRGFESELVTLQLNRILGEQGDDIRT